jgi:hypothetical protein
MGGLKGGEEREGEERAHCVHVWKCHYDTKILKFIEAKNKMVVASGWKMRRCGLASQ